MRGKDTDEFDAPSQDGGLEVLVIGQGSPLENLNGIDNGDSSVEFSTRNIIIQILPKASITMISEYEDGERITHLSVPLCGFLWHSFSIEMGQKFLSDDFKHLFELLSFLRFRISRGHDGVRVCLATAQVCGIDVREKCGGLKRRRVSSQLPGFKDGQ